MLRTLVRIALPCLIAGTQAKTHSTETPRYLNTSSPHAIPTTDPTVCCFAFQPTVTANFWNISTITTRKYVAENVTTVNIFYTQYEDTVVSRTVNQTLHNVSTSTVYYKDVGGENPLRLHGHDYNSVTTDENRLNGTATMTGGVLVQSPAAFYEYRIIDIITVAPVTENGKVACGTTSSNDFYTMVYKNINENAQSAYYSSYSPAAHITLDTPMIYQPAKGAKGATTIDWCERAEGVEDYGYLPEIVLKSIANNPKYVAQFTGLISCLPGGPAIFASSCVYPTHASESSKTASNDPHYTPPVAGGEQAAAGGDLTVVKAIYATMPGRSTDKDPVVVKPEPAKPEPERPDQAQPIQESKPSTANPIVDSTKEQGQNSPNAGGNGEKNSDGSPKDQPKPPSDVGQSSSGGDKADPPKDTPPNNVKPNPDQKQEPPNSNSNDNNKPPSESKPTNEPPSNEKPGGGKKDDSIGGIINSIIGGNPQQQVDGSKPGNTQIGGPTYIDGSHLVVIPGPTRIPLADAPQGVGGSTQVVDGKSYLVIPAAVTYYPTVANIVVGPTSIILNDAPADLKGSTQVVDGKSYLVIPTAVTYHPTVANVVVGPTSIILKDAPAGLQGSTQVVDGKSYLVVSTPQTIAAVAEKYGIPTTIGGVPFLVIGPTNIPLAGAPNVEGKTTVINGASYLQITGSVTVPVNSAGSYGVKTTIGGIPYLQVGPTIVPVKDAPPGLEGKTTMINGTPFIVVTSPTKIPLIGSNTVASGHSYLVIEPTRIPLSDAPTDLKGETTTTDGTPYLVVPTRTSMRVPNGQLTMVVDGTSQLILAGPMTIPVNSDFSIQGSTMVVDGTTMVVVSERTTVTGKWTGVTSSSGSVSKTVVPVSTSSKADGRRLMVEMWVVSVVLVVIVR